MGDPFKNKVKPRLTWDEYFMKIAMLVAERSTCRRHHVGAVIVRNKQILTTGYNGAPAGTEDCLKLGCLRDELDIPSGTRHEVCRATHAEQNAIIQAGVHGVIIGKATVYCTHSPCILCAKMLINAGIIRLVTYSDYPDTSFLKLFEAAQIVFEKIQMPHEKIETLG